MIICMKKISFLLFSTLLFAAQQTIAQKGDPTATELWQPEPKVVTPPKGIDPPSDAIILFDGKNLDEWEPTKRSASNEKWTLVDGTMLVNKKSGDFQTKRKFKDFQLHIEYRIPADITGSGQSRGNSGIFMAALPWGAGGYELQVLDNYNNTT